MSDAGTELRGVLGSDRVMAILRYRAGGEPAALRVAMDAVCDGGIRVLEATADTPGVWDAVAAFDRPDVLVGVGTVVTVEDVQRAADAGARFIVSPGLDVDVVTAAHERGLATLPGVATATEVMTARRAGADLLKLFPAGALGVAYLRALRGPFGDVDFVPTGGVAVSDIGASLAAGAFAVALGSELAGRAVPSTAEQLGALTERAAETLAAARGTDRP